MSGTTLANIADRVLNRPLLLHPDKAELILQVLDGRIGAEPLGQLSPEASRFVGSAVRENGSLSSYRVESGVAVIPIVGSLVNRGAWIGASSGLVSYEGIAAQLREAEADPDVKSVLLDIDSGGGEATGMSALASRITALDAVKPVVAFVNDVACSAAYGIASAAREIVVSPTSIVGSIGVLLVHMDYSKQLEAKGIKPTLIHAGANKVDGNAFEPLPQAVRADMQAMVSTFYDGFVELVAQGRAGALTSEQIRATEARTYIGAEAIAIGLADRIASLDEVLASMQQSNQAPATDSVADHQRSGFAMSKPNSAEAPQAQNVGATQADHQVALEAARAEGVAAGKAEASARIKAILQADEAKGREAQAMAMALETEMSAEDAIKVLGVAPKANPSGSFEQRVQGDAEFGGSDQPQTSQAQAAAELWGNAIKQANASIGVAA